MREFKSAAKSSFNPNDTIEFPLDGETLVSYRPTEDQIVLLVASEASEIRSDAQRTAAFIDVCLAIFDQESRRTIARRLMNPEDSFMLTPDENDPEAASLIGIVQWLIEEWSDRPTKPFSDSTSLPENGGVSSTEIASAEVSTSSDSLQLLPAT